MKIIDLGDVRLLLGEIIQSARNLTSAERCSVFLSDENTNELVATIFDGISTTVDEVRYSEVYQIQQMFKIEILFVIFMKKQLFDVPSDFSILRWFMLFWLVSIEISSLNQFLSCSRYFTAGRWPWLNEGFLLKLMSSILTAGLFSKQAIVKLTYDKFRFWLPKFNELSSISLHVKKTFISHCENNLGQSFLWAVKCF